MTDKAIIDRPVVIIGAGPAGLTAARRLRDLGTQGVLVVERNPEAGGLPRFCGHPGWGLLDFGRVWRGPVYARKLVAAASGVEILTDATVTALHPGGRIEVSSRSGPMTVHARAALIATGIREAPRSARLVGGSRPWGVTTTGAFQEMVYAGSLRPFRRPVIVGSELVSFSALLTARHAGIRPVAMIEEGPRIVAYRPGDWIARWAFGVPVMTNAHVVEICGTDRVEAVLVERAGHRERIACDGVIFTGQFTPEATLARLGHLHVDPRTGGPSIDDRWRCSDPAYFAAGNVLRPVEHSGFVAAEARRAADSIATALTSQDASGDAAVAVMPGGAARYVYPQRIVSREARVMLYGRADREHRGHLRVAVDGRIIAERRVHARPERRLAIAIDAGGLRGAAALSFILD